MKFGGRKYQECPICEDDLCTFGEESCVCTAVGEYCFVQYNDYHLYDIFWVTLVLVNLYNLYYSGMFAWEILRKKALWLCPCCLPKCCFDDEAGPDKGKMERMRPLSSSRQLCVPSKRFSAMESIMILTFLGCALRFTWVITIVNGRNAKAVLVSAGVESILLKVPQIFWIAAFLYTALVWRRLADQCSKLAHHKTNQKRTLAKLSLKINLFNLLLIGCCIPAYIVGNVSYPYLVWWVDYFMTFVVFGIFCLGVRFGWQLINQLETSVLADILIPTIKWVLRVASMGCWTTIIASFAYNMYFRGKGQWYALGYATMVHHFAETMLVLALLKTKKDAVKRAKANENMKGGMARGIGLGIGSRAASSSKFNSGFKGGSFRNASKAPTNSSMRFSEMSDVTNNTLRTTTMTTTSNTQEGAEIGKGRKMSKRDVSGEKMKKLELGKEQLPQHAAPAML